MDLSTVSGIRTALADIAAAHAADAIGLDKATELRRVVELAARTFIALPEPDEPQEKPKLLEIVRRPLLPHRFLILAPRCSPDGV